MVNLNVTLETLEEDKDVTVYEMVYNKESYLIFARHNRKFHNRLYTCKKEIPDGLEWFLHHVIEHDLRERGFLI